MPLLDPAHDHRLRVMCNRASWQEMLPVGELQKFQFPADEQFWENIVQQARLSEAAQHEPHFDVSASHDHSTKLVANQDWIRGFVRAWEKENPHVVTVTGPDGSSNFRASERFWAEAFPRLRPAIPGERPLVGEVMVDNQGHGLYLANAREWDDVCAQWEVRNGCTAEQRRAQLQEWKQELPTAPAPPSHYAFTAPRTSIAFDAPQALSDGGTRLCHHGALAEHCARCDPTPAALRSSELQQRGSEQRIQPQRPTVLRLNLQLHLSRPEPVRSERRRRKASKRKEAPAELGSMCSFGPQRHSAAASAWTVCQSCHEAIVHAERAHDPWGWGEWGQTPPGQSLWQQPPQQPSWQQSSWQQPSWQQPSGQQQQPQLRYNRHQLGQAVYDPPPVVRY
eukprot:TRINITY_DN3123_c0_g2_i2.p1 TRINITY_DN3123_c0_g2~~TRINITY_DN3123_c0_g2_i2.p1  ORF type:complete len:425 (+),score=133.11 TRINITY_DN3123_c0_g2_i2:94-1275(+)